MVELPESLPTLLFGGRTIGFDSGRSHRINFLLTGCRVFLRFAQTPPGLALHVLAVPICICEGSYVKKGGDVRTGLSHRFPFLPPRKVILFLFYLYPYGCVTPCHICGAYSVSVCPIRECVSSHLTNAIMSFVQNAMDYY